MNVKKTADAVFFGEGIFTMGYSKNYNVLGGFYSCKYSTIPIISLHKLDKIKLFILCRLYMVSIFCYILLKKGIKFFPMDLFFFQKKVCAIVKDLNVFF